MLVEEIDQKVAGMLGKWFISFGNHYILNTIENGAWIYVFLICMHSAVSFVTLLLSN